MEKNSSVNTKVVIEELHRAFNMFNENLFHGLLPEPAILIQSRGNKKLTLGWCSVKQIWKNEITMEEKYEINIVAEALNRGVYPVMATLLHEMVHLSNLVNGIKDTSRGFTYHNMKYKKTAEAHGLEVDHADKIGWSVTKLSGLTMDLVDSYNFDEAVFSLGRIDSNIDGDGNARKKVKTSSRKYICPECGTSVRASKDVFLLCGDCTNLEEGKIVAMYKEVTEDDEQEEPIEEEKIEKICTDCGSVVEVPEEQGQCLSCGDGSLITMEQWEMERKQPEEEPKVPISEPLLIEKICRYCANVSVVPNDQSLCAECGHCGLLTMEQFEELADSNKKENIGIVEVDTKLIDGDGKKVDVKQSMIHIDWTIKEIESQLKKFMKQIKKSGMKELNLPEIEISNKLNSQYGKYKEGSKIIISEKFLNESEDKKVIEVLKHLYIHHLHFLLDGSKVNHMKAFKDLCKRYGVSIDFEYKNHRAIY